jgi:hypothetical protein
VNPGENLNCVALAQVIGYFYEEVMAVYGLLANLEEGFSRSNIALVSDAILFSLLIFVTCNTAHRATDEVRNFWNSTIYRDVRSFNQIDERKQSSGMWYRVYMVLTDVSEERIASRADFLIIYLLP